MNAVPATDQLPLSSPAQGRPGAPWRELVLVASLLLVAFGLAFALANAFSLFTRDYWYDEAVTQMIAGDPDLSHAMKALAAGVDSQPPGFYLLLRGFVTILGGANELTLRSFAVTSVFMGLLGVYASLRFGYRPLPSLAALLALAAHPLLLFHAVEARPYNLLFASVAWFAYFLLRCHLGEPGVFGVVGLMTTAILVCTTHYFGIICLSLVLAGDAAFSYRSARANRLRLLGFGTGLLALVACLPFLHSQRAAFSVSTWLPPPEPRLIVWVLKQLFLPPFLLVFFLWWGLLAVFRSLKRRPERSSDPRPVKLFFGLLGLALFPIVLLVLSYLLQPVLLDRYALTSALVLGLLVAFGSARQPTWAVALLCGGLCITYGIELNQLAAEYRAQDVTRREFRQFLRDNCAENRPIAFQFPIRLYGVERYAPDLAAHCYQLDYDARDADVESWSYFTRDQARLSAAHYGQPRLLRVEELKNYPVAYLYLGAPEVFPRFHSLAGSEHRHLGQALFELKFPRSGDPEG